MCCAHSGGAVSVRCHLFEFSTTKPGAKLKPICVRASAPILNHNYTYMYLHGTHAQSPTPDRQPPRITDYYYTHPHTRGQTNSTERARARSVVSVRPFVITVGHVALIQCVQEHIC